MNAIVFKFNNQDDTSYFFNVGFFNEGFKLPAFGENPLQQMAPLSGILGAVPLRLYEGEWVGSYQVPVDLLLRGCKSKPWLPEDSLDDILVAWEPLTGFLVPEVYEILYTPVEYELPEDYDDALDASTLDDGYKYFIPNDATDWPEEGVEAQYRSVDVAGAVSAEGAYLQSGYEWLFTGEESDPDNGLKNRLWGSPTYYPQFEGYFIPTHGAWDNLWGVYDPVYPADVFKGLYGAKAEVDIFSGLAGTFPFPVYEHEDVTLGILHPSKEGVQVTAKVPYTSADDFVFPASEIMPLATPPQLGPIPFVALLPFLGLLMPQVITSLFPLASFKFGQFGLSAPRDYLVIVNDSDPVIVNDSDRVAVGF